MGSSSAILSFQVPVEIQKPDMKFEYPDEACQGC